MIAFKIYNTQTKQYFAQRNYPYMVATYTDLKSVLAQLATLEGPWEIYQTQTTPLQLTPELARQLF